MDQGSDNLVETMQNCKGCQSYSTKNDKIGHSHCPIHRQCSGKTQWEPDLCQHCIAFRDNLPTLSPKLHKQALKHLSEMLYRMRRCIGKHQNIGIQGQRTAFLGAFSEANQVLHLLIQHPTDQQGNKYRITNRMPYMSKVTMYQLTT